ncbi:MAG TPA: hypothetical protein VL285_25585 [Bryobacteraceae bacterium]|nr:hypothetical protein [Bryobacteraceae bacterium]
MLRELKRALSNLRPEEVRHTASHKPAIGLVSSTSAGYAAMEDFLAPPDLSRERKAEVLSLVHRAGDPGIPDRFDLVLYEQRLPRAENAFTFYAHDPSQTVKEILADRSELGLPLARNFQAFRRPVINEVMYTISRENALFSLATALPNIVPSMVELPWAIGEFASDTAFLTMNQIRMAFLVAAASDNLVGYREQKAEIVSIITGAFGFRAIARELIGKIPFGGGLIPKAAVAFAGTYVVGLSLERYHRVGYGLTREERRREYESALVHGRTVAEILLAGLKKVDAA